MQKARISLLFLVIFSLTVFAFGQDDETVRIETNLVSVGVVVKDKNGNYVNGLKKEQFKLFDNKEEREIEFFSESDAPVSYGIIYDLHPTTSDRTRIVLESLKSFTSDLHEADDFFTIVFNERGSLNLDFVPTVEQIETHLSREERNKPNSLYDAVFLASEKIQGQRNAKKTLIIISDGKDHFSHHSFATLRDQLRRFNLQIYSILVNEDEKWNLSDITLEKRRRAVDFDDSVLDRAAIEDLSDKSGGKTQSSFLRNSRDLLKIYKQIESEMHHQYSIGFYPKTADGKWHSLKVKTDSGNQKLTYRKGYQSASESKEK